MSRHRVGRWFSSLAMVLLAGLAVTTAEPTQSAARADDVLATVEGAPITQADLQLEAVLRRVSDDDLLAHREMLLEKLIDQRLIDAYLAQRKAQADPIQLDSQMDRLEAFIRRRGEEPAAFYERIGLTEEQVRGRLSLSIAWAEHVRRVTSDQQLREEFASHRRELDGTELRAAHIVLKVPESDEDERRQARTTLAGLRDQIIAGTLTFEAAAAEHSQGPSAADGGDVGFFAYRGTMPAGFSDAAFSLKLGDVSEPIDTPFGVHLIKVTEERPGQLSLEDARPQILERISQQLWDEQVAAGRRQGKVVRADH